MTRYHWKKVAGILIISCVLLSILPAAAESSARVRGLFGVQGYGYDDENGESHLWLLQSTRISIYQSGGPLSFHFSGGYIGDNQDDFSESGRGRFLKGYIRFNRPFGRNHARVFGVFSGAKAGRFFLHRGVATGMIDGLELNRRFGERYALTLFGGMMSPLSREFEFGDLSEDLSVGGELKINGVRLFRFRSKVLTISYVTQQRDGRQFRNRLGFSGYFKPRRNVTALAVVHLRLSGNLLKKALCRVRYQDRKWHRMIEAGIFSVDLEDYSWFTDFEHLYYKRMRFAVDRYFLSGSWAGGLEGSFIMTDKNGFRFGPVITSPLGQLGYRLSSGDQALSSGPWASLKYSPVSGFEIFAYGALVSYEWESRLDGLRIESDDLMNLRTGMRYRPVFRDDLSLSVEYQMYSSPQFDSDRRLLGGINWRFDTAGRNR